LAHAAYFVGVPAIVANHLRTLVGDVLGDGNQKVGSGEDLEVAVDLGIEPGTLDDQVGRGLQRHFLRNMRAASRPQHHRLRRILEMLREGSRTDSYPSVEALTDQFSVLAEDHARVDPGVWERAGQAINQRERLRLGYQRFDGVRGSYEVEPYSGRKELTRWVLSWMPHVRVLAPPELRERVRQ